MTQIGFYHLTHQRLEDALPRLLEKVLASDLRVHLRLSDPQRMAHLNRHLWTYAKDSFLPHGTADEGYAEEQPIYLSTDDPTPNGATILTLVDGAEHGGLAGFDRCLNMFNGFEDEAVQHARNQWKRWKNDGHALVYWQQEESGRWIKKAES